MKYTTLTPDAKEPTYATDGSAAMDFYACLPNGPVRVPCGTSVMIPTGLAVEPPPGSALFLLSRSGHGAKNAVRLANCVGLIDPDYRGNVMVAVTCDDRDNDTPFVVRHGDRIAQGVIMPFLRVTLEKVEALSTSARGEGGFGSTGRA